MKRIFRGWVVVAIGLIVLILVFGSRFSLGLFMPDLTASLNASLSSVSLVFAVSTLVSGAAQPVTGWLADRYGPAIVIVGGLVMMGLAFIGTGFAQNLWHLAAAMGVLSGLAFSAANVVILSALISRWFVRKRGQALGIVTSGSKIGSLVVVPSAGAAITLLGWRPTMILLGMSMLIVAPFVWRSMRKEPADLGLLPDGDQPSAGVSIPTPDGTFAASHPNVEKSEDLEMPAERANAAAIATPAFWMISGSLFGNGFMMNLIYFHLPSYLIERHDALFAAGIMALMGGIGIFGTIASGASSDRIGRKNVLAILYMSRALVTVLLITVPGVWTIYLFAIVFGFLGYGAVALTSGITGDVFGVRSLGIVFGTIYVLHQVGGAIGTYVGGFSYDLTGSYTWSLLSCVAVSVISAILVLLVPLPSSRQVARAAG